MAPSTSDPGKANWSLITKENKIDKNPEKKPKTKYKKPTLLWLVVKNQLIK